MYKKNTITFIIFAFAFLFYASFSCASSKGPLNTAHILDVAGQQRMFTHQILVSYAQIGQIQSFGNPVDLKIRAINQFEKNLNILKQDEELLPLNSQLQAVWNEFKSIVNETPDKSQIGTLIRLNEQLMAISNNIIKHLLNDGDGQLNMINISGQQRMLSQRIALFMLVKNWNVKEDYQQKLDDSLQLFAVNMTKLKKNKDNTKAIKRKLTSVAHDYKKLMAFINNSDIKRDNSFAISRLTAQILRKSKISTKLYVALQSDKIAEGFTSI
jgi:hypothetical protein